MRTAASVVADDGEGCSNGGDRGGSEAANGEGDGRGQMNGGGGGGGRIWNRDGERGWTAMLM